MKITIEVESTDKPFLIAVLPGSASSHSPGALRLIDCARPEPSIHRVAKAAPALPILQAKSA